VPLDWAVTQNGLGDAPERLGERESNPARLEEAVAAYNSAIAVYAAFGLDHNITVCRGNRTKRMHCSCSDARALSVGLESSLDSVIASCVPVNLYPIGDVGGPDAVLYRTGHLSGI
jgi:hypothetical protein